jgi:hypothetical protein
MAFYISTNKIIQAILLLPRESKKAFVAANGCELLWLNKGL